jgi:hypothetical protein
MHHVERRDESTLCGQSPSLWLNAAPASIAAGAALLERNWITSPSSEVTTLHIIGRDETTSNEYLDELALTAALTAVAAALAPPRRSPLRVSLNLALPGLLTRRHRIDSLVKHFAAALGKATAVARFIVRLPSAEHRTSDADALVDAARRSWREREWAVLQGTLPTRHSPLRRLPSALVQHILELVAADGRTHVSVEYGSPGQVEFAVVWPVPISSSSAPHAAHGLPHMPSQPSHNEHGVASDGERNGEAALLPDVAMLPPAESSQPPAGGGGTDVDAIAAMLM